MQGVFIIALVWSIGGPLHDGDRVRFDNWLRSQLEVAKISHLHLFLIFINIFTFNFNFVFNSD